MIRTAVHRWLLPGVCCLLLGLQPARAQEDALPLGTPLPMADHFFLNATENTSVRLADVAGSTGTVLVFYCNRCLWVEKYEARLMDLAAVYAAQGIRFVLVNANDPSAFPLDAYAACRERARSLEYPLPYLIDDEATLAQALGAERTPQVYVFDAARTLVYTGTIDDSPMAEDAVQDAYLKDALDALVQGTPIAVPRTKPFGCAIRCPLSGTC